MPTELEETQVREFLKRAEIRTMKKDLRALREVDALKERDKIAKIKTLEEQRLEQQKKIQEMEDAKAAMEKIKIGKILSENATQERLAEKDLKQYATEQERQQIFFFESQRLAFGKKIEEIDNKKDPALKLEKNTNLLAKQGWQEKINAIAGQEKKLEDEQGFVIQKSQTTAIASEKKSLEERRGEIEKELQNIEKSRWAAETEMGKIDAKIIQIDKSAEDLVAEKNDLNQKILGADKSLREIYSGVIERVEQQKAEKVAERESAKGAVAEARLQEKENFQRQQWNKSVPGAPQKQKKEGFSNTIVVPGAPVVPMRKKTINVSAEEGQRKKFMEDVEKWAKEKEGQEKDKSQPQTSNLIPPKKN